MLGGGSYATRRRGCQIRKFCYKKEVMLRGGCDARGGSDAKKKN